MNISDEAVEAAARLSKEEAIERVLNVFADRPSGPDGYEILSALGVAVEDSRGEQAIERTATLTFTRDCTLCGGDIHVVNGERQRHTCKLPNPNRSQS